MTAIKILLFGGKNSVRNYDDYYNNRIESNVLLCPEYKRILRFERVSSGDPLEKVLTESVLKKKQLAEPSFSGIRLEPRSFSGHVVFAYIL